MSTIPSSTRPRSPASGGEPGRAWTMRPSIRAFGAHHGPRHARRTTHGRSAERPSGRAAQSQVPPRVLSLQTRDADAEHAVGAGGRRQVARLGDRLRQAVVRLRVVLAPREAVVELVVRLADVKRKLGRVHHEHGRARVGVVALALGKVHLVALPDRRLHQLLGERRARATWHADKVAVLEAAVAVLVGPLAVLVKELEVLLRKLPVL
mmetsp:Transcript_39059/g.97415  ORF Transcript_39059/g.97415 Transcript_39059/m.97415 type:complete len:208 (-) Transcript_39059:164-787(-)